MNAPNTNQLPEGRYVAKAVDVMHGYSKNQRTPMIEVLFQVMPGDYDASFTGKTIARAFFLSEKALPISIRELRTLGFVGDDLRKLDTIMNRLVTIVVEQENGYPKIKYINQIGWGLRKDDPMTAADFANLAKLAPAVQRADVENAQRDAERRANRGTGGGYSRPAPVAAPPPARATTFAPEQATDDVPFLPGRPGVSCPPHAPVALGRDASLGYRLRPGLVARKPTARTRSSGPLLLSRARRAPCGLGSIPGAASLLRRNPTPHPTDEGPA